MPYGVACLAHPVGYILTEAGDTSRTNLFPVTLLAIAFVVALVRPMGKHNAVFQSDNLRTIFGKSGYYCEKNYR